jgi:sodium/potassium/calcium exchanger 6
MECTHQEIFKTHRTAEFLCKAVATKACAETQDFFNFFEFYWCDVDGKLWIMILVALFLIFVIFKYTSITVEEYIAEGIQNITEWLGLSDSLAAVTLLAFANGAGDVITAIVASDAEGGVSYNIGALYGAGLFVCSMVVGICILQSKEPMVFDTMIIYRDIGFYIGATVITILFAWYGQITWWGSTILLIWYVIMVVTVVAMDDAPKEGEKDDNKEPLKSGDVSQHLKDVSAKHASNDAEGKAISQGDLRSVRTEERHEVAKVFGPLMLAIGNQEAGNLGELNIFEGVAHAFHVQNLADQLRLKLEFLKAKRRKPEFSLSPFEIFIHFVEAPFMYALILTVLPCDKEQYSRRRCLLYPIPGMLFSVLVIFKEFNAINVSGALGLGIIMFTIFYFTLDSKTPPKWFIWLNILGVIGGLMWTYVMVGLLIDLLGALGIILNLDTTYLGLTVLAVGNALPDALTTIALCKAGAGTLALSGGYAGQLFGLLIGFGISMLKLTLTAGPQPFDLFDFSKINQNLLDIMVIGTVATVLCLTFFYAVARNFVMDKLIGVLLLVIYGAFITCSTVVAVRQAINTSPK